MATRYRPLAGPIEQFLLNNKAQGREPSSQRALAQRMGTTPVRLNRVIRGHTPLTWEFGNRLASALGVQWKAVMEAVESEEDDDEEALVP